MTDRPTPQPSTPSPRKYGDCIHGVDADRDCPRCGEGRADSPSPEGAEPRTAHCAHCWRQGFDQRAELNWYEREAALPEPPLDVDALVAHLDTVKRSGRNLTVDSIPFDMGVATAQDAIRSYFRLRGTGGAP